MVKYVSPDQIVKNMASFRYIDKEGFTYTTPIEMWSCDEAYELYNSTMQMIEQSRKALKELLVAKGVDPKRANECANFVLPRATNSSFVIGFTPEALIHFMHKRLCSRAQTEIRILAVAMKKKVAEINPEFAKELVPHCQHLLWCPEGNRGCGMYPTKDRVREIIDGADR